ncbi:hypothetical protein ANO11243_079160 [Dothideomycetidae sp. 11243]|nr:hypothetical protein ANO11243_079160 [fungal sp. No.11243]
MATKINSRAAIGTASWIKSEREQLTRLIDQDVEEFGYSARNELEWLNEHMAEIFNGNQMHVTDVFKTPGKLRGKTPRTARKDGPRAPLTDLFAPNPQSIMSPARSTPFFNKISKIAIASDNESKIQQPITSQKLPAKHGKANTDSGYHGMAEDDSDPDAALPTNRTALESASRGPVAPNFLSVDGRSTEESFVSAQDGLEPQGPIEPANEAVEDDATTPDNEMHTQSAPLETQQHLLENEISIHEDEPDIDLDDAQQTLSKEQSDNGSFTSSPERPLPRKSSLNFASLPPRETLTGKRSFGVRNSQFQTAQHHGDQDRDMDADEEENENENVAIGKSGAQGSSTVAQNKTSTQLLHEKISMLGQTREPRPSKSIPTMYPQLLQTSQRNQEAQVDSENDDDDSWIAPIADRNSTDSTTSQREQSQKENFETNTFKSIPGPQKSISTPHIASPSRAAMDPVKSKDMATSASVPNGVGQESKTPTASPKKFTEGPLSASKARFYSVLKSAKGMFASSAGTTPSKESLMDNGPDTSKIPGGFADDAASISTTNTAASRPLSAFFSPSKDGRKTRSSTENDRRKKAKEEQKVSDDLDKIREKERQKATQQKNERARAEEARRAQLAKERVETAAQQEDLTSAAEKDFSHDQPQELKSMPSAGKLRAPGRLARPTKQATVQSNKPVPVNIRVASQSQRLGSAQPSTTANASSDVLQTPGNRPASAASRPGMNRTGSANPPSNARVKALEAAARKKELEEKAAARKAEQKKELERKRAAKLEEERRAEQERKAEEQRRIQEARAAAQKQAEQRKLEQQRREAAVAKARADAELAEALEREKARAVPVQRTDLPGTIRQLTKATVVQDSQANKAAKRPMQWENDEVPRTSTMNRGAPSYQQQDAKRRRTEDEDDLDMRERHSVMAPPKRPSNMRKEAPMAAHHAQNNIYKASVSSQPLHMQSKAGPAHPAETIKLSTARIPFAESTNSEASQPTKTPTANAFKTPARPAQPFSQHTITRSSPAYPNGDNIALPEIHTDSEDESDSDDEGNRDGTASFRAPSWVASPALRDLLTQQQLVDPESVFGPIAALNMDDIFRGATGKSLDRLRRYRERGESALWTESGDAVTSAEKRRDREARERVVRDGGWSFTRDI